MRREFFKIRKLISIVMKQVLLHQDWWNNKSVLLKIVFYFADRRIRILGTEVVTSFVLAQMG